MRGSVEIGQSVGPFVIVSRLGRGGMATVYSAYETGLDREVALKVLPLDLLDQPGFSERFEREARLIAKLEHPHIVPLYNYGIDDGVPWMALRLVRGGNFGERMEQGALGRESGLAYFTMIADALDHAHSRSVVHRDLKPQNVLLGERGELYLADFGIARLLQGRTMITSTGTVLGTPQYMSPEQAQDGPIGPATDIYALGVMVYRWLSGNLPFDADTPYAVMFKHVHSPLAMEPLAHLPETAREVLVRALAKNPEHRWPTASAFIEALVEALHADQTKATTTPSEDPATKIVPSIAAAISARKLQKVTPPPQPALQNLEFKSRTDVSKSLPSNQVAIGVVAGVVLLLVSGALIFGGEDEDIEETPAAVVVAPPPAPEVVPAGPPGRLLIDTDAECTLTLNEENKGVLKPGVPMRLELPPNAYRAACVSVADAGISLAETKSVQSEKLEVILFQLQIKMYAKEQARLDSLRKQQEQTRQAELERKQAEAKASEERKRIDEETRKRREALMAEEAQMLEEARKAAELRKREEAKRLDDARKAMGITPAKPAVTTAVAVVDAEQQKKEQEKMRQAEATRRAEAARKAEEALKQEAQRQLEQAQLEEQARALEVARLAEEARLAAEAAKPRVPVVMSAPQPPYPVEALRSGITGEVEVEITIDRDGSVSNVRIVRAHPRGVFDRAVLSTVGRWRYQPLDSPATLSRTIVFR